MLSVGSILQSERERRGLTLKQVEKQTHIRQKFLSAIERDDFRIFSSKIYIVGLIKNYARFFNLDEDKMIAYFRRQYEKQEDVKFKRRVESGYFKSEKRRFVIAFIVIIIGVFASFFGYQLFLFFSPPEITLLQPEQRSFESAEKITLVGQTEPDAEVRIFDERVFQNEEGIFQYDIPLNQGKNIVSIEVTGANGQQVELEEVFIRQE